MNIHKKALSLLLSIVLVFSIFTLDTVGASAATQNPTNYQYYQNGVADTISLDLDNGPVVLMIDSGMNAFFQGSFQDYGNSQVTLYPIDSGDSVRIYQSNPSPTPNSIFVWGTAFPFNLTLDGVNIDTSEPGRPQKVNSLENQESNCAFCISSFTVLGQVNLKLNGTNKLSSGPLFAGLQVEAGSSLTISDSGNLTASGGMGASGIGGGIYSSNDLSLYQGCGDITVNGGKVIANGGAAGTVTMSDSSTVDVYGGAGIGGGGGGLTYNGGNAGSITIGGGAEVAAYGNGGGGGRNFGGDGGNITISGGTVTAKSSGAVVAQRDSASKKNSDGFEYGCTVSQGDGTYDIYCAYSDLAGDYRFQAAPVNSDGTQGTFSDQFQIATDGAGIGNGGNMEADIQTSEIFSHTDSKSGGAITISGGTVTATSTETTDTVLGGAGIGNSEASYYYKKGCSHYTLGGSCVFTGGSINTNLMGSYAVAPAPTDEHGNPVYKTATVLPDINTPTAVTVIPAGGSSSPAQTDARGGLSVWLPATNDTNTVAARVSIDGTERSYEMKGAVKTDGTSELTPYRTDAELENLTFNGQTASLSSPPNGYQVNVGSGTTQVTVLENQKSDLRSFTINGKVHSGTDTVTLALFELETDLSIHVVTQDNTAKDYIVRVKRAASNDAALSSLTLSSGAPSPAFSSDVTNYTANVGSSISQLTVTPVIRDSNAKFTVNGRTPAAGHTGVDVSLNGAGSTTTIYVEVTAQDGTKKIYSIAVTRASSGSSADSSSSPSSVTDASTGIEADFSSAVFPSSMTNVKLFVTKSEQSDRQTTDFRSALLADTKTGIINIPEICNISVQGQSKDFVSFTGTVMVRIPLPMGVRGAPHVFCDEPGTGKFSDMNAKTENGYLVFNTNHFGYFAIAGVGNAVVLDTLTYQMPVNGKYQIGLRLPGTKSVTVKYNSTDNKIAVVTKLKNGNYQVIGKDIGTVYIMFDVYDDKNRLLTHASVRVDVKSGIRPRGDSTRQFGVF